MTSDLPSQWIEWVARNLLRGVAEQDLIGTLVDKGFPEAASTRSIIEIASNPILTGCKPIARRLRNIEAMLNVRLSLANQRAGAPVIKRREKLSVESFHAEYYAKNVPVVVTDVVSPLAAFSKWSLNYLRDGFGEEWVDLQSNRRSLPVYEVFLKGHTAKRRFADLIDRMRDEEGSNDCYLTANDRLFENSSFSCLLDDVRPFPPYFSQDNFSGKQFIWMGPKDCVSPLHRDRLNVFMMQITGRKRILLVDSTSTHVMYNFESFFSEVDPEWPAPGFEDTRLS
jgi:hypothetical protein